MRLHERFGGQVNSQDDMGRAMSLVGPPATTGQPVHLAITSTTSPHTLTLQCNFAQHLNRVV